MKFHWPMQELSVGSFPANFPAMTPIIILLLLLQQPLQKRSNAVVKDGAALPYAWAFLTAIRVHARWEQRKKPTSCTYFYLCFHNSNRAASTRDPGQSPHSRALQGGPEHLMSNGEHLYLHTRPLWKQAQDHSWHQPSRSPQWAT